MHQADELLTKTMAEAHSRASTSSAGTGGLRRGAGVPPVCPGRRRGAQPHWRQPPRAPGPQLVRHSLARSRVMASTDATRDLTRAIGMQEPGGRCSGAPGQEPFSARVLGGLDIRHAPTPARTGGLAASLEASMSASWNMRRPATGAPRVQAMARVWRDGQKRPCTVYRLLTTGATACRRHGRVRAGDRCTA